MCSPDNYSSIANYATKACCKAGLKLPAGSATHAKGEDEPARKRLNAGAPGGGK